MAERTRMRVALVILVCLASMLAVGCWRETLKEHVWVSSDSCKLVDRVTKRPVSVGFTRILGLTCSGRFYEIGRLGDTDFYGIATSRSDQLQEVTLAVCGKLPWTENLLRLNRQATQTGFRLDYFEAPATQNDCYSAIDDLPGRITPSSTEAIPDFLRPSWEIPKNTK